MCSPISQSNIPLQHECSSCFKNSNDNSNVCNSAEFENIGNAIRKIDCDNEQNKTIIVYPKILKIADKDVETPKFVGDNCEKKYEEDDELRRRAYRMYREYLAGKNEDEKPSYVYIEPRRRPFRGCGAFVCDDERDCVYDPRSNMFLAIVFMILFVMLLCTTGFIYVVLNTESLKEFFQEFSLYISLPALTIMVAMNYIMACSECTRLPPCNFLCLLFAVASMSVLAAVVTVLVDTTVVLMAFAATAAVVFFCILLAYSHFDFTTWFLYVIAIFVAIFAIGVLVMSVKRVLNMHYGPIELFILIVSTIVNVVILVIELQMILGGRSVELDERDYALGAFLLYTSIIELFLSLVQITGVLEEYDE